MQETSKSSAFDLLGLLLSIVQFHLVAKDGDESGASQTSVVLTAS